MHWGEGESQQGGVDRAKLLEAESTTVTWMEVTGRDMTHDEHPHADRMMLQAPNASPHWKTHPIAVWTE